MRLLMLPAQVTLRGRQPLLVSWREPVPSPAATTPLVVHEEASPAPAETLLTAPPGGPSRRASPPDGAATKQPGRLRQRLVACVLDRWHYDGRWWQCEVHRDYLLLELRGGDTIELFREGEAWWLARADD